MGYAEIAGIPPQYGLYGSIFPILAFALFTTSKQFIFGVDAAPAALVGALIISLGVPMGTQEAVGVVALITVCTALWLLMFYIFKAGKLLNFISTPVMAGFISGIGTVIITMQAPKLIGGSAGHGEFVELFLHFIETLPKINYVSLALGVTTLIVLFVSKRFIPKFPMSIVVMILGALCTVMFNLDKYGVKLLSDVKAGMPELVTLNFGVIDLKNAFMLSLPIAIVILAESLLASSNFAAKNNDKLDQNREIFGYFAANLVASLVGCCAVNGSVSRTVLVEQYGGKSKIVSFAAGITMLIIVCFATGFIKYLPVPVLTAIVIVSLTGVLEFDVAYKLFKVKKTEFLIFAGSFIAVLVLGTIYGVIIGLLLSFAEAIIDSSKPSTSFLGVIPGKKGFHSLGKHQGVREIDGVIIYRFSGNLFFANIAAFAAEIENAIQPDTKVVIVDASGINSIDFTAAENLELLVEKLNHRGVKLYLTEHQKHLNDELRKLGLGHLIESGVVRKSINFVLMQEGYVAPYVKLEDKDTRPTIHEHVLAEFEWAFGDDAEEQMEKVAVDLIANISKYKDKLKLSFEEAIRSGKWRHLGAFDKDKLFEHLEMHLNDVAKALGKTPEEVEADILEYRHSLDETMQKLDPEFYDKYIESRQEFEDMLKINNPEIYANIEEYRKKQHKSLIENHSE